MRIAILGYGQEGKSAEQYFQKLGYDIRIFDHFTPDELSHLNFDNFDLVLRSPSVPPHAINRALDNENRVPDSKNHASNQQKHTSALKNRTLDSKNHTTEFSSCTQYFFDHCSAPIIGVTGTKGKGTTCSLITTILQKLGQKVWLVGNIGKPALDILDKVKSDDVIVYELSSFQLWDLTRSPHIAGLLRIEPDHLNIHTDFNDYLQAKGNIVRFQKNTDVCVYCQASLEATKLSQFSAGQKIPYPAKQQSPKLTESLNHLVIPGQHNRENAEAALLIVASFYRLELTELISQHYDQLAQALAEFRGLPHRIEFLRELNGVKYYDDNFSTTLPSLAVALAAFPQAKIVTIIGGRDKTNNADLPKIAQLLQEKAAFTILIGESGRELAKILPKDSFILADSLAVALSLARTTAEEFRQEQQQETIILMSPAAASFDMFNNVYDRGAQFQKLVQELR